MSAQEPSPCMQACKPGRRCGVNALHMMAVAGAARLLLHKSALCAERGFCEMLLVPLVAARASAPAKAASFQHADVQAALDALFKALPSAPHKRALRIFHSLPHLAWPLIVCVS